MNIHFTDKNLFEKLKKATLAKVVVGSRMYGIHNDDINKGPLSDTDFLYIYATSENELTSAIQTHHQLQFIDEDGNDHNFVSLHTFVRNILNGDSTINFEVVQSGALFNTNLEWLHDLRSHFITYTIIRSYLGLARRDVKHYHKANTEELKKKRLGHIIRGYIYAKDMIHDQFNFKIANCQLKIILDNLDVSNNKTLKEYDAAISNLRDELNEKFNNKTLGLAQHMNIKGASGLTYCMNYFCRSNDDTYFNEKQKHLNEFDMSYFINAFENWVEY